MLFMLHYARTDCSLARQKTNITKITRKVTIYSPIHTQHLCTHLVI